MSINTTYHTTAAATEDSENSLGVLPPFHIGHVFSQAMPEIIHINGLPLADLLGDTPPQTLDSYVDEMEQVIQALNASQIVTEPTLMPPLCCPKQHLLDSLAGFYEANH